MKKVIALAALGALAAGANAQSNVVVYGIVDAGVSIDRPGDGTTQKEVKNGVMAGSRLGFRGAEDLGGDLKAIFNIEMAFSSDTGTLSSYIGQPGTTTAGVGWNRRSFVGLQSSRWGTLMIGRDYTPFFWTSLVTDNFGLGLYGSNLNQVGLNGGVSENLHRASNAVFYESPAVAGFTGRATASLGAERSTGEARLYGVGGDYRAGGLLVSVGYQTSNVLTVPAAGTIEKSKILSSGLKYNFGTWSLGGGHAFVDRPGPSNKVKQSWFGGSVQAGTGTVIAQISQMDFDAPTSAAEGKARVFGVAYTYPFSRQTIGYVSYGRVNNSGTARLALYGAAASVTAAGAGLDPAGFAVGIRKNF